MKLKARCREHVQALCRLAPWDCGVGGLCDGGATTWCSAWNCIDPFKRKLLEIKYKNHDKRI